MSSYIRRGVAEIYSVPGRDAAAGTGHGDACVVDTSHDPELEAIVAVLRDVLDAPTCLLALSKRHAPAARAAAPHAHLGQAFLPFLGFADEIEVVEDMRRDPRFAQHAFVAGEPNVRFLVAAALPSGGGALLALGFEPRKVTPAERRMAAGLARAAAGVLRWREAAGDARGRVREFETKRRDLEIREQRLLQTERIAKVGSWERDLATGSINWSDETYRIYELPVGTPVSLEQSIDAYAIYERERLKALIDGLVKTGVSYDSEFDFVTAAGVYKRVRAQGAREEKGGAPRRIFGTFQDVTEEHMTKRQLWRAANCDSLTGLANRNRFDEILTSSDAAGALLVVDADYLKDVNDTLGHAAGDELLRLVARSLIESAGPKSTVARIGGDEFAIIVPAPVDAEALQALAHRIVANMQRPISFHGANLRATVSIGGAIKGAGEDPEALRQAADLALYHAKAYRRGGYAFYHEDMKADIAARAFAVKTVDEALRDGRVQAYYQPVVELSTGLVTAFEALARVQNEDGDCSIGQFAEALHDSRTATRITARILECIGRDVQAWRSAGVTPPRIAVNLGPRDFQEGAIEPMLRKTCENAQIEPRMLAIEVTELVFISRNANIVSETSARLRAQGHIVALDDFGTGHASLAHLATFPVDVIKMDRTFIMQMNDGGSGVAIAGSLIELAHKLGIQVIAEGVESESQLDQLIALNCDKVQGYLFCRPLAPKDIGHLLVAARRPDRLRGRRSIPGPRRSRRSSGPTARPDVSSRADARDPRGVRPALDLDVADRERVGDAQGRLLHPAHDVEVEFGAHPLGHQRILDVADELELHRPVADLDEQRQRRRDRQHRFLRLRRGDQQRAHRLGVALVGGIDVDRHARDAVVMQPVLHRAGDQGEVRHDQSRALERLDLGGAGVDAAHEALVLADHHPVADADALLPQQDQAGDEIVGDALQAEADADREAAGDPGEPVGVDAEPRSRRDQRHHDANVAEDGADRIVDAGVEPGARQIAFAEPGLHRPRRRQDEHERQRRRHQGRDRQRHAAEADAEIGGAQRRPQILARQSERADNDDQRGDDRRQPHQALQQHDDLFEAAAAQAERRHHVLGERRLRLQQPLAALLHQGVEQVERGDGAEHLCGVLDQIGGERDVAGERAGDHREQIGPGEGAQRPPGLLGLRPGVGGARQACETHRRKTRR